MHPEPVAKNRLVPSRHRGKEKTAAAYGKDGVWVTTADNKSKMVDAMLETHFTGNF